MPTPTFEAIITPTPPLSVKQFYSTQPSTPGNVGVCLSGGGSRALCAGMGQLQALNYLGLLGKVKALATVSGGSWLGVPYVYLPANGPTDNSFLGSYVTDQGTLTLAELGSLPEGNGCVPVSCDWFSPELLALSAFVLRISLGVPSNMLWQTLVALNILSASQLFEPQGGNELTPADTFSYNQTTWDHIVTANPALKSATAYLFADAVSGDRIQRPFLICNVAMLVSETGSAVKLPASVQVTAFTTGVFGNPQRLDGNGQKVGGGGVTSFAFNSDFVSSTGGAATVSQSRHWSLTDAVGSSSAFFAFELASQFAIWEADTWSFLKTLGKEFDTIIKWIENHLPFEAQVKAKQDVKRWASVARTQDLASLNLEFPGLSDMIPQYDYWPVAETKPPSNPQTTQFADGGNLENTGVASMVAYSDIDSVIAFINSSTALQAGQYGVSNGNHGFVAGTNVIVDESVPPLFGYQPYDTSAGYVLYPISGSTKLPAKPQFANNQVFSSVSFSAFLQGIWNASLSSSGQRGTNPAIFSQQNLVVQANSSFGVVGGQSITVVWCYLSYAQSWADLFSINKAVFDEIQSLVSGNEFPNYSTRQTQLTPTQINLLANFTAWSIVSTDSADKTFSELFANPSA